MLAGAKLARPDDSLLLEDESGRVRIQGPCLAGLPLVTGKPVQLLKPF